MTIVIASLLQNLTLNVIANQIVKALNFLLNYRYFFRRIRNYLSDTKVQANLSYVTRYETEPTGDIDMGLFREISQMSDAIVFDAIDNRQNILRVKGNALPTPLEIKIEPMPTFENGSQQVPRYEIIVRTYTEMAFGYRSSAPLAEFQNLSEDIAEAVQEEHFDDADPNAIFLTGEIKGKLPIEGDRIEDEDIQMRAKQRDDKIQMTFRDPRNLTRGIQKYFQPL